MGMQGATPLPSCVWDAPPMAAYIQTLCLPTLKRGGVKTDDGFSRRSLSGVVFAVVE